MLHGFNFSKLVLLSTLIFTYSNAFFNTMDLHSRCAAHTQSNWWWCGLFQIVRSRENHKKKYWKIIRF